MSNLNKRTHEALVADWQENAKDHDDENYRFLRRVKQRVSSSKVDRIALKATPGTSGDNTIPNGAYQARDGARRNRSSDCGRCALRLCRGGCGLWAERAVPPRAYGSQACLGGRHPSASQSLSPRRANDLARCQARLPATAACPRYSIRYQPKTCSPMPSGKR